MRHYPSRFYFARRIWHCGIFPAAFSNFLPFSSFYPMMDTIAYRTAETNDARSG
jgi:hypothetical protein